LLERGWIARACGLLAIDVVDVLDPGFDAVAGEAAIVVGTPALLVGGGPGVVGVTTIGCGKAAEGTVVGGVVGGAAGGVVVGGFVGAVVVTADCHVFVPQFHVYPAFKTIVTSCCSQPTVFDVPFAAHWLANVSSA
jgi:hypothetical protein